MLSKTCREPHATRDGFDQMKLHAKWQLAIASLMLVLAIAPAKAADAPPAPQPASLSVFPAECVIRGADQVQQLIVSGPAKGADAALLIDFSRQTQYASSDPKVAIVTTTGVVIPKSNGSIEVTATLGDKTAKVKVTVEDFNIEAPVSFRNQVVPIFTKHGCNSGGCHGKAIGPERLQAVAARLRRRLRLRRPRQGSARPARLPGRARAAACCC